MGYTTEFEGHFDITPPLEPAQVAYLTAFSESRRMERHPLRCEAAAARDPLRVALGMPVGSQGGYCVGLSDSHGDSAILDYNSPPSGQPGLWCDWAPSEDGAELAWNGNEKFYGYAKWLEYLVAHFFIPWGRVLSGSVTYQGEEPSDFGKLVIKDNELHQIAGVHALPEEDADDVADDQATMIGDVVTALVDALTEIVNWGGDPSDTNAAGDLQYIARKALEKTAGAVARAQLGIVE